MSMLSQDAARRIRDSLGVVANDAAAPKTLTDELRMLAEEGSKLHSPGMPEHTICRGLLAALQDIERLRAAGSHFYAVVGGHLGGERLPDDLKEAGQAWIDACGPNVGAERAPTA